MIFSLANAVGVALYVVGFAETVADLIIVSAYVGMFTVEATVSFASLCDFFFGILISKISCDLLQECESCSFTGSRINDIRVIGIMIVLVLFLVALIGLDWEAKVS